MAQRFVQSDLLRSIGAFGSAQVFVQATAFVSGLLIVRLLAPDQYALYTLANAFLGALNTVSDGGLANASLAEGGKVFRDPRKLGAVLASAFALRRQLSFLVALLILPAMAYLLLQHGSSFLEALVLIGAVGGVFYITLANTLYQTAAKLHQSVGSLGKIRMAADAFRMVLLICSLPVLPIAWIAVGVGALPQWWANRRLKLMTFSTADLHQPVDVAVTQRMKAVVRKALPGSLFYAVKGQFVIFLVSLFGSTMALAQVGALGRLSQIVIFFSAIATTVAVPRFARVHSRTRLFKAFSAIMAAGVGFVVLLLLGTYAFSKPALWLLGSSYENLNAELFLAMAGSGVGLLTGLAYSLGAARGWIVNPAVTIVSVIAVQVGLLLVFDVSTLQGVLTYNLVSSLWPLSLMIGFVFRKLLLHSD